MYEPLHLGACKILVGLGLERQSDVLLNYCQKLAPLMQAKVRLTHAINLGFDSYWLYTSDANPYYFSLSQTQKEQELADAKDNIQKYAQGFPFPENVEIHAAFGNPAEVLMADSIAHNCQLIVVGTHIRRKSQSIEGMSTALSLMAHARTMVMAVPQDAEEFDPSKKVKIMFADDLKIFSKRSIDAAVQFCSCFPKAEFAHVHFCPYELQSSRGDQFLRFMNVNAVPGTDALAGEHLLALTENRILDLMKERRMAAKIQPSLNHSSYYQKVFFGKNLYEQLAAAVEAINPDFLVFGKHAMLHLKPFSVGKLPYSAMLAFKRPVLVVPIS